MTRSIESSGEHTLQDAVSAREHLLVRLEFDPGSSHEERNRSYSSVFDKLNELMDAAPAFSWYKVLTNEDIIYEEPSSQEEGSWVQAWLWAFNEGTDSTH